MELNERKELLNPIVMTEARPRYISMAHMMVKWLEEGKETEKWRKILVIVEGKMSLSWDAESK